jgi:type III restriction enzyme
MAELKAQAAQRWIRAVNASGEHGVWEYRVVRKIEEVGRVLDEFSREFQYTGKA